MNGKSLINYRFLINWRYIEMDLHLLRELVKLQINKYNLLNFIQEYY